MLEINLTLNQRQQYIDERCDDKHSSHSQLAFKQMLQQMCGIFLPQFKKCPWRQQQKTALQLKAWDQEWAGWYFIL